MPRKAVVGGVPGNILGMLADLTHKLQHGVRTPEELGLFLKGQDPFVTPNDLTEAWQAFYTKFFPDLACDLSGLRIPERKPGFDRLIVVVPGLTLNLVYEVCQEHFPCWRWTDDLDKAATHNDRDSKSGPYAIWIRDRREADEELKNLSANNLKQKSIPGITLLERLLLELMYYEETGNHLDVQNITLANGSRGSGGGVPDVDWGGGWLLVGWCGPDDVGSGLRGRAAVV